MEGVEIYSEYILKENLNVFTTLQKHRVRKRQMQAFLSRCVRPGKFRMYSRTLWVLEKNRISYLETPGYALWFHFNSIIHVITLCMILQAKGNKPHWK